MDIGTEMDVCFPKWHPSSWQLTSNQDSTMINKFAYDLKPLMLTLGVLWRMAVCAS